MAQKIIIKHKAAGLPVPVSRLPVPIGLTIEQIAIKYHGSCNGIKVFVRGLHNEWEPVPADMWRHVRPKTDNDVIFIHQLHGGNKNQVFAIVAMIALTVIAPYIAGPAGLGFAAGTLAHSAATAAITIGGSLAIQKLFPADQQQNFRGVIGAASSDSSAFEDVTTDSNVLGVESYLPIVVGKRRITPPDIVQPRSYLENGVQVLERLQACDGPHLLTNPQIDRTPVNDFDAITTEIKNGNEEAGSYTFVNKISVPVQIAEALNNFNLDGVDLVNQDNPEDSEPSWVHFATPDHQSLEEINIRLRLDAFYKTDSATQKVRVPLRLQFRLKGTEDWHSIPEIHIVGRNTASKLLEIRIRWDGLFGDITTGGEFDYEFWQRVPQVTSHALSNGSEIGDQWQSHAHFIQASGYRDVKYILAQRHYIRVDFLESVFPKGAYEWRMKRGWATNDTGINTNYSDGSDVVSMFYGRHSNNNWQVPKDQGAFVPSVNLVQATTIANEQPCQWPSTALIAYKSKGQSFRNSSVEAARYIKDWDGTEWATETADSKNPASHYRQILYDFLVYNNVDPSVIVDDEFVAWRQECIDQGYECNAIFAGESIHEVLSSLATAGFARPRFSDGFGIDFFRDRTTDLPVQTFSLRNAQISFEITAESLPAGLRVKFDNEEDEFKPDELVVTNEQVSMFKGIEATSYKAITKPSLITRRGTFDLLQRAFRKRIWTVETAIEGVVCEVGDLVGIVSDLFDDESHGVRIREVIDAYHISIDQIFEPEVPPSDLIDPTPPSVSDLFNSGERSIIFVPTLDGMVQRTIVGVDESVLRLDDALPGTDEMLQEISGSHANITTLTNASHRCFVINIERGEEETAVLTLVDEAPEINEIMKKRFP